MTIRLRVVVGLAALLLGLAGCSASSKSGPTLKSSSINPATVDCHDPTLSQAQYDAACGVGNLSNGSSSASPSSAVQTEGSVTTADGSFVQYPDGAVFRVAKVQKIAAARCYAITASQTCVLAQVSMKNTGTTTIVFADGGVNTSLYYGANRYQAEDSTYQDDPGAPEQPKQLVPNSSLVEGATYVVPTNQLSALALALTYSTSEHDDFTGYTFTDVQTLLS